MQTDPDFEHVIVSDDIAHGLHWANRQIKEQANKLHGKYVYILDDDDYISNCNFIKDFKILIENLQNSNARPIDVVICRGKLNGQSFPKIWKQAPERSKIASTNMIVRREVFDQFAYFWDKPRAGDYHFINAVYNAGHSFFWWNYEVFWAESSCGLTEEQKEMFGFYG